MAGIIVMYVCVRARTGSRTDGESAVSAERWSFVYKPQFGQRRRRRHTTLRVQGLRTRSTLQPSLPRLQWQVRLIFFILNNFPFASSTSSTLLLECLDGSLWNYYSTIPISFTTEDLGKPGLTHSKLGSRHNNSSGFLSLLSFDTSGWAPVKVLWKYYSSMSICLTTENFGSVFNRYQSLFWKWWKSRSVGIATKSWLLFKSLVWLVVYYRCDSLMLKSAIVDRIKWFEMKASRQILQVTWIEKRTKDWYYGKLEQNLFLLQSVT